ncbi:hypothetical protein Mycsm_07012 (plasmid) [Mycobacterium sp. JS623]|uniref:hypothetical protein n=1 Tax=Mycobacterium sp. JS623 TaxID=212767 RepID=UPI0002A559DC|nr:hypothetical protein [Mycobacterium sp. JS623]AGB27112.1 hypothetical protein Mycsm_07012 [Mycobacterium sp. JS623]
MPTATASPSGWITGTAQHYFPYPTGCTPTVADFDVPGKVPCHSVSVRLDQNPVAKEGPAGSTEVETIRPGMRQRE